MTSVVKSKLEECKKEHHMCLINAEKCLSLAKDALLNALDGSVDIEESQNAISKILSVYRDINKQMLFVVSNQNQPTISSMPLSISPTPSKVSVSSMLSSVQKGVQHTPNVYTDSPCMHFNFVPAQMNQYFINYESECIITFIRCLEKRRVFIMDYKNKDFIDMRNFFKEKPQRLRGIPKDTNIFGVFLEGFIFRAAKQRNISPELTTFNALLIDSGEIMEVNCNTAELYVLKEEDQKRPALCLYCVVEKDSFGSEASNSLENVLYTQKTFKILKLKKNSMRIELMPLIRTENGIKKKKNPFLDSPDEDLNIHNNIENLTNPFVNFYCKENNDHAINNNPNNNVELHKSNGFGNNNDTLHSTTFNNKAPSEVSILPPKRKDPLPVYINEQYSENFINNGNTENNNVNLLQQPKKELDVTELERAILFAEEKSTTNPLEAVMGFIPKDEERLCKFYDPTTGGCFKGVNCKLKHLQPIPGGWSRDVAETKMAIAKQMIYPEIGTEIYILVTHIINVEEFYCQILKYQEHQLNVNMDLRELNLKLNAPEYQLRFKPFERLPVVHELVLALWSDKCWYRAQVHNAYEGDLFKIFFVDYGNCRVVGLSELCQWHSHFDYLPFQAVHTQLDNVTKMQDNDIEAIDRMKRLILNRKLIAKVIRNENTLHVLARDFADNTDIGDRLVSENWANAKKPGKFVSNPKTNSLPA